MRYDLSQGVEPGRARARLGLWKDRPTATGRDFLGILAGMRPFVRWTIWRDPSKSRAVWLR